MDRLRRLLLPVFRMFHSMLIHSSLFWTMLITSMNLKRIAASSRKVVCILWFNLLVELTEHSSWLSRNRFYTIAINHLSSILMFQFLFWVAFILQWLKLLRSSGAIVLCWIVIFLVTRIWNSPDIFSSFHRWYSQGNSCIIQWGNNSFLTFILLFCLPLPFMHCLLLCYRIRTKSSFKARLM